VAVEPLMKTLEQEVLALTRGASLECLACGEFVLHRAGAIECPECGSEIKGEAGTALQLRMQAG
jgi:Zn finger protein HypA/HybF involved in hydrogenase expression